MTPSPLLAGGLWIVAGLLFACVLALGRRVTGQIPHGFDVEAIVLRGRSQRLAHFFTLLGRGPALAGLGALALLVAVLDHAGIALVAALLVLQTLSQGATSGVKLIFRRARPDYWIAKAERDHSFPSGHSVTAVVFFGGLAGLVATNTTLPRALAGAIVAVLVICVIGIPWSRLSLAAHYPTDVLGGMLFGSAWLCIAVAVGLHFGAIDLSVPLAYGPPSALKIHG